MNLEELTQLYNFTDRTILITGGAGILGGEIACALVGCGANVVILDRDPNQADRLLDRLDFGPGSAVVVYGNVLEQASLIEAEKVVLSKFGPIDTLINAAGGNIPLATTTPELSFFDLPEDALKAVFDLNMMGTVLASQVYGRKMADLNRGIILNFSSMNAFRPLTRIPAYSAAKAAISNFTQWLSVYMAKEYSPEIRVNALAPGFFHTKQNHFLLYDESSEALTQRGQQIIDHTPMGRFGDPEDLLGAMMWLLSPTSKFVTGVVIPIDGGFSAFSGV